MVIYKSYELHIYLFKSYLYLINLVINYTYLFIIINNLVRHTGTLNTRRIYLDDSINQLRSSDQIRI